MNWSAYVPAVIALCGIPLTYFLTVHRESNTRRESWEHEKETALAQQKAWIQQQWWQEKQKSYALLIEAMYQLKVQSDATVERMYRSMSGRSSENTEFDQTRWKENLGHLQRINEIGAFTVSPRATQVISNYFKAQANLLAAWNNDSMDPLEVYEEDAKETKIALEALRHEAHVDLELD